MWPQDVWRERNPDVVQYTYWGVRRPMKPVNKGWRLDYFMVSEALKPRVANLFVRAAINGSDHCPIGIDITPA